MASRSGSPQTTRTVSLPLETNMRTLETKLTRLEQAHEFVDLRSMTANELDSHIKTLKAGAPGCLTAVVTLINRRGSVLPVVKMACG